MTNEEKIEIANKHYTDGVVFLIQGEHEKAIECLTKAIELGTTENDVYLWRGHSKKAMKLFDESLEDLNEAIKLKNDFALAYCKRGEVKHNLKRYEDAIDDFNEAMKLDNDYATVYDTVYSGRGRAKAKLMYYEEALEDLDKAIELVPSTFEHYFDRGSVKYHLKRYEDAIDDFNEAIRLDHDNDIPESYLNRGMIKDILGQYPEAIEDWLTGLYLSIKKNRINFSPVFLSKLEAYPQNILSIFDISGIQNPHTYRSYLSTYTQIEDFIYLLEYYDINKAIAEREKISQKTLLHYHLGGNVTAFIAFDEVLLIIY